MRNHFRGAEVKQIAPHFVLVDLYVDPKEPFPIPRKWYLSYRLATEGGQQAKELAVCVDLSTAISCTIRIENPNRIKSPKILLDLAK